MSDSQWSFWKDEAKLSILDTESCVKFVLWVIGGISSFIVPFIVGTASLGIGTLRSLGISFCAIVMTWPLALAIDMGLKGKKAGINLRDQRDAAIAAQEKQIDRTVACAELTDLIRRGRHIREAIESAVFNPPGRNSAVRPTSDAEHPWQFQQEIERIAKDRYPSLYAALIAAPDPGTVRIGPSHNSSEAAKLEQILNLLSKEAARFCG
jgi:hypothetical protein